MRRLLVLRPEPGASATAQAAEEAGWAVTVAPLFTIEPCAWDAPDAAAHDALILTSANAVRHAGPGLDVMRTLPVFAVGRPTADAARAAGLEVIATGAGGLADLLPIMAEAGVCRPLHLAGVEARNETHPALTIRRIAVYRARAAEVLAAAASDALAQEAIALLHSPRAAALFASLVPPEGIRIAALSPAVAAAAGSGWQSVAIADRPVDAAMLAAAARLCETASR